MIDLKDIKNDLDLLNAIDWDMTNEEAVRLYLEWGNNWARGNYVIRGKDDSSLYFVVNTWGKKPVITLIRRNSEQAEELAHIDLPKDLERRFLDSIGHNKGVYSIEGDVRKWLEHELHEA